MNIDDTMMNRQVSRRTLLKTTGAVGLGLMLAQAGLVREVAAQSESVQEILNITATTEAFGVTFLGAAIESARNGGFQPKPIPAPVLDILEAARAQEQFHLDFFRSAGGELLTDTFTLPDPRLLTDYDLFFRTLVLQEAAEIAAQIAAMRTYTELQRPDLVKVSFQYAAEEAEHRVLANYALGTRPANDIAFAPALFSTVGEFLASLRERGIIGGRGQAVTYPGPGAIDPTNVINRTPDGPQVACSTTPGLPETGAGDNLRLVGVAGGLAAAAAGLALARTSKSEAAEQD